MIPLLQAFIVHVPCRNIPDGGHVNSAPVEPLKLGVFEQGSFVSPRQESGQGLEESPCPLANPSYTPIQNVTASQGLPPKVQRVQLDFLRQKMAVPVMKGVLLL